MEKDTLQKIHHAKPVEKLTFIDGFMFSHVMKNPEICAGVVELLLGIKVAKVKYVGIEKVIQPYYDAKGVRFDVYLKDSDRVIDIEAQAQLYDELPLRTRYYQSLIDTNDIVKGADYSELSESFVVFICKGDKFGKGLSRYTFRNICAEDGQTELGDRATKMFVNASAFQDEKNLEVSAFLRYICSQEATTDFTRRIESQVQKIIADNKFRTEYARVNLHERDIRVEERRAGRAEGRAEAKAEAQIIIDAQAAENARLSARIKELEAALAAN